MQLSLAQALAPCLFALSLVGAASPASFAQAPGPEGDPKASLEKELRKLRMEASAGLRARSVARARQLCRKHAGTPLERLALFTLSNLFDVSTPAGKVEALRALRRLSHLGPGPLAHDTYARVQFLTGWSFAAHVRNLEADQTSLHLDLGKGARPGATYTLYRLPPDRVQKALIQGARLSDVEGGRVVGRAFANSFPAAKTQRHVVSRSLVLALPDDPKGAYALAESIDGFRRLTAFTVTSFGMVAHVLGGELLVYTFDPRTGEPLSLPMTLVSKPKPARNEERPSAQPPKVHQGRSDAQGLARFPLPGEGKLICRRGEEVLTCEAASSELAERELVFVCTDRPVYRPGQLVNFKAIYRRPAGTKLALPKAKAIRVEVRDSLDRVVQAQRLEWSAEGTLSGTFQLSDEPAMGQYSVGVAVPRHWRGGAFFEEDDEELNGEDYWRRSFAVAAYRKPAARVSISFASGAKPGSVAIATLKAEYFHGGPVANATVDWSVDQNWAGPSHRGPLLPLRPPFEDPLAWLYEEVDEDDAYSFDFGSVNERSVLSGTGTTGPDGTLKIAFPTSADHGAATYTVRASVSDDSRLDSECEAELKLESAGVRVAVGTSVLFTTPGAATEVRVRVTDPQGAGVAKREVRLSVLYARDPSGESVEFEGTESLSALTDATGLAIFSVRAGSDGRMRFVARAKDAQGNEASGRCGLWIAGPKAVVDEYGRGGRLSFDDGGEEPWICPACKQESVIELEECLKCGKGPLLLLPERLPSPDVTILGQRLAYRPGETARFLVRAPSVPLTCLLLVEGATFHVARVVRLTKMATVLELPVKAAWGPNVFVKLKGWRGNTPCGDGFEISIAPPAELVVRVEPNASSYAPGDPVTLRVVTTRNGAPAAAEVEVAVVDERVLAIVADTTPDLRTFFRLRRENSTEVRSTTTVMGNVRSLSERSGYAGGGGGGAMFSFDEEEEGGDSSGAAVDEGVLKAGFSAKRSRKRFPDTLLYRAHVRTNAQGVAELPLRNADSLTTWRVKARAVSGSDFAQSQTTFDTRQDVVLRVATPRFLVEGDRAVVATVVHNRSAKAGAFVVALRVKGAKVKLVPGGSAHLQLEAGAERRVDWEVIAGGPGSATFSAEVASAVGSDAVESSVEVQALGREHGTSLTGHALGRWSTEVVLSPDADPARATLEVSAASGPLGVIAQALPFLAGFPYGCVEQTMSRFLPAVVATGALERNGVRASERLRADLPKMTAQGLSRLYGFQHEDGGWGWWKHDETDEEMTIYVLFGLLSARRAGIKVEERVLKDGLEALCRFDPSPSGMAVLAMSGDTSEEFKDNLNGLVPRSDSERAWLVLAGRQDLIAKLPVRRPRTSKLSDVVEGSLVLRALIHAKAPRARIDAHVEWLIQQRQGPLWNTTLDTAQAVYALSAAAGNADGQDYLIEVNGKKVPGTLIKDGTATVSGSWLRRGKNQVRISLARSTGARVFGSVRMSFRTTGFQPRVESEALTLKRFVEVASVGEDGEVVWTALASGSKVDRRSRVRVRLEVGAKREVRYLLLESPLPAGAEGWSGREPDADEGWWDHYWYSRREFRDDRVSIATSELDGEETFTHELRLTHPGTFKLRPAHVEGMYEQGSAAESESFELHVTEK